jgi:hypothetical protein
MGARCEVELPDAAFNERRTGVPAEGGNSATTLTGDGRAEPPRAVGCSVYRPGRSECVVKPSQSSDNDHGLVSVQLGNRNAVDGILEAAWTLVRAAFPAIAVATLIPMALFYLILATGSIMWAIGALVLYAYGFAALQYGRRRRVSGMLLLTVFMVTLRAVAAVAAGQSMVYFAIPVAQTAGFALMFVATMWTSEPLIVRLARDLVPHLADDLAGRRALIRGLSLIWMATYLASAATTFTLLTTVSLPVYMGAHQIAGWCWVGAGVALSVSLCRRRGGGLIAAALAGPGIARSAPLRLAPPSKPAARPPVLATP